jgi:hypothetical protein
VFTASRPSSLQLNQRPVRGPLRLAHSFGGPGSGMSTRWQPSHSEQGRLQTASVDIVPEHVRAAAEHGLVTPKSATPAGSRSRTRRSMRCSSSARFTTWWAELSGFGARRGVVGIEGPAWTIVDAPGDDADARLDSALRCAQLTENFAEIVDASAH